MAKRHQPGVTHQDVQPQREHRVDQHLGGDVHVVAVADPQRDGCQDEQRKGDGKTLHSATRPNKPCGRTTSTMSIGRNKMTYANSGNIAWPKLYRKPTTKLPTNDPVRLPEPPRITTTSASGSMSWSRPGYTDRIGPPMTPANPASPAPRQNTMVNRWETRMPTARAIDGSSTAARIIAPSRVLSSNPHRAAAIATAMAMMTSR